jgi:hypothetical protein
MMAKPGFRAQQIHCFFAVDGDDEEGLTGKLSNKVFYPLVATDGASIAQRRLWAAEIAAATGQRIEHVVFEVRSHVEWIEPN